MDGTVRKAEGRNPKAERRPKPEARKGGASNSEATGQGRADRILVCQRRGSKSQACRVRAVTFDVGGTLIECWPSVGDIYAEIAAHHGFAVSAALLNRRFKAAWRAFPEFRHSRSQWAELVDTTFSGLVAPSPSRTFFPMLYKRFSEPGAWHVYDDVLPALQALKARGLKLGIISNWDNRLRPLLRRLGLDVYFEVIVVSCEQGVCKPSAELFAKACAALGSRPENTLHVGDHPHMDLHGARAAGLQARWLRRGRERSSGLQVGSLRELYKI